MFTHTQKKAVVSIPKLEEFAPSGSKALLWDQILTFKNSPYYERETYNALGDLSLLQIFSLRTCVMRPTLTVLMYRKWDRLPRKVYG